jgi:hypothetical protein
MARGSGAQPGTSELVLLVGMPLRHLQEAASICAARGSAVLPAGGQGDLVRMAKGTEVLLVATQAGEEQVPAATWTADFVGSVPVAAGTFPEGLPEGWVREWRAARSPAVDVPRSPFGDDEDDEPLDPGAEPNYFEVRSLTELPTAERIFVNELVPKQERGGRTYVPRSPRLVERPP